jgi:hypothetical protein
MPVYFFTEKQQVVVFRLLNPGGSSAVLRGLDTEARAHASPLKQSKAQKGFCFLFPDSLPHNVTHPQVHFQTMAVTAQLF